MQCEEERPSVSQQRRIAYFSMEIAFHSDIPTYSGGLGVLAGDTVRSAADWGVPLVAVTLVHREGYFNQSIDAEGVQHEAPASWEVENFAERLEPVICVQIERRNVLVRAWRYIMKGVKEATVPIILLDTDTPENSVEDRTLTDHLYGGDPRYRLCQEAILGIGGMRMLRALGFNAIERFHLNEGHAALLTLELLNERLAERAETTPSVEDVAAIRRRCVFTTHTPVPAGHDRFPIALVDQVLGRQDLLRSHASTIHDGHLNMTYLALNFSRYANAVAKRHGEVSRRMFPEYVVDSITNGVHAVTWTSDAMAKLFDRYIALWREENFNLRHATGIPRNEVWGAHHSAKRALIDHINSTLHTDMNADVFTIGFARRAATYKRADMLVSDVARLKAIVSKFGPLQIVYGGKAHPHDSGGKDLIRRVHEHLKALGPEIKAVYLPNYEMHLGALITAGVDLWVNTPQRPLEASGTSGMKAALNGVPSLSVLDGWWVEGCIEHVTGWAIGADAPLDDLVNGDHVEHESRILYDKIEHIIFPMYLQSRDQFIDVMRHAIAINGSYFNTQRMMQEYVVKAYFG
jgi:starch phosphorylase